MRDPDLVVVADETLITVAAASVLSGVGSHATLLLRTSEPVQTWRERLQLEGPLRVLPAEESDAAALRSMGAACAGAAARLTGVLTASSLERALRDELAELGSAALAASTERALAAWTWMEPFAGSVSEGPDEPPSSSSAPEWIDLPADPASVSEPAIRAAANSLQVRTGLWRLMRPVLDTDHCHHCTWICTTFCPDGAISPGADRRPEFDLEHCKGCMVCVAVCPTHAIRAVPEREAG
jgi:pyruvate ferredoxin oxidoreductase gamma subunit